MFASIVRGQLIKDSVGNNMKNIDDDVRQIKKSLSFLGRFDLSLPPEPHGIMIREMDTALKGFQREKNLKVDGILKPGGAIGGGAIGALAGPEAILPGAVLGGGRGLEMAGEAIKVIEKDIRSKEAEIEALQSQIDALDSELGEFRGAVADAERLLADGLEALEKCNSQNE